MNQSESINELAAALAKAQAAIRPAVKDKTNPAFRSKYADLSAVWEACREALTSNGLSVVQFPVDAAEPGRVALETTLLHTSGQWLRASFSLPLAKNDPQGMGSGLSYARRYALAAVVGVVADEDDDGNAASQAKPQQKPQAQQSATYEPQRATAPRLPSQAAPADEASIREAAVKAYAFISGLLNRPVNDMAAVNRALGTTWDEPQTVDEWRALASAAREGLKAKAPKQPTLADEYAEIDKAVNATAGVAH